MSKLAGLGFITITCSHLLLVEPNPELSYRLVEKLEELEDLTRPLELPSPLSGCLLPHSVLPWFR